MLCLRSLKMGVDYVFRINITVSEEVNAKLDSISKKWGVSKSNLCAMVLGQYVDGVDKAYDVLDRLGNDISSKLPPMK